jgi:chromosomal replication initiation ATPase DnaA
MKFTEKYFEKFLWNSRFMVLAAVAPNDSAVSYLKKNLKQKIKDVIAQHDKSLKILIGVVGQPQAKKQHTTPLLDVKVPFFSCAFSGLIQTLNCPTGTVPFKVSKHFFQVFDIQHLSEHNKRLF